MKLTNSVLVKIQRPYPLHLADEKESNQLAKQQMKARGKK